MSYSIISLSSITFKHVIASLQILEMKEGILVIKFGLFCTRVYVHSCGCACVCSVACMRVCVSVCTCVRACVRACVCVVNTTAQILFSV